MKRDSGTSLRGEGEGSNKRLMYVLKGEGEDSDKRLRYVPNEEGEVEWVDLTRRAKRD